MIYNKKGNIMKKILLGFVVLFLAVASMPAQSKIGFVQSDRIRAEFEEFKDAESQLQMEFRKVQFLSLIHI